MVTYRSGTFSEIGTTSAPVVSKPAGAAEGDVVYVALSTEASSTVTCSARPSGFTRVNGDDNGDPEVVNTSGTAMRGFVFRKTIGASEPSSWTFTMSASTYMSWSAVCVQDDGGVVSSATRTSPGTTALAAVTLDTDELAVGFGASYSSGPFDSTMTGWTAAASGMAYYRATTAGSDVTIGEDPASWWSVVLRLAVPSGITAPEAVDDLAATAGDTQAVLTWTAPADGGEAITDYVVNYRAAGSTSPTIVQDVSAGFSATRSPSFTLTAPQENDVIIVWPSSTTTSTITPPTGWTNVLGGTTDVETDSHQLCALWHRVAVGETAQTAWALTNLYDATETGNIAVVVVRGAPSTSSPIAAFNSTFDSANAATPHVLASIANAGSEAGGLVLSGVAKDATGAYTVEPTGWTFVETNNTNMGKAVLRRTALTTASESIGATNITPSAGDEYASITVVVAPTTAAWSTFSDGTSTTTGATVTGLTNGVEYEFRVAAVNTVGQGAWSNTDTATPAAPSGVEINPTGAVSATATGTVNVGGHAGVIPTGAASLTATGTANVGGAANLTATGAVSATATGTANVASAVPINPTGAVSLSATTAAVVAGQTDVTPSGTASISVSGTANITATAEVAATGAVSTTATGTANVGMQTDVNSTGAVSLTFSATANVGGAATITPTGTVSPTATGISGIAGQTDLTPTGAVSVTATSTANVGAAGTIDAAGAVSSTTSGTANVSATAAIQPTGATSTSLTGTASITPTTTVNPTGIWSGTATGTADVTGGIDINPAGTNSLTATGTATVTATTEITPTGAVSLTVAGTANVGLIIFGPSALRTFTVEPDDRTFQIRADYRTHTVTANNRTLEVRR